eukprot:1146372-Pelagomonas_calceolata.AAC.7
MELSGAIISCAIGILYLGGPVDLPLLGAISLPLHEATKATQSFTGGIMPAGSASHPDYLWFAVLVFLMTGTHSQEPESPSPEGEEDSCGS